ncbi:tyrosine-type recombinase/integrase [Chitinophaga sp. GCM10012297]|uniref:Tyrosine-type recombinase/integrase n=1 Tax=Chitinophaga chungangae TaxID=2821488 RepID=A0ABS3YHC0_9BACT|nr:tyrosine-type recombinase/integrase [Chitinophaga chungangae]MBO9154076.1 tyrosine-type recombinase/integrase [Chitinophaga chungangae]
MHQIQLALSQFKSYLQAVGYSTTSVYMLPYCTGEFLSFTGGSDLAAITVTDLLAFYDHLQVRPLVRREGTLSGAMIDHYGYGLRVFFNWLQSTGQIDMNPASGLRLPRWGSAERQPLNPAQIGLLFDHAGNLRNRVILHLFYSCGLRRSEAEALNIADVSFTQRLLYVRSGKGARRRVVPLPASVAACLERYYLAERQHAPGASDPDCWLLNRVGQRLRGGRLNEVVGAIAARAKIAEPVTAHRLRHSIATHLLGRGMDMEQVRVFLGHRCLETTQRYAKTDEAKILAL